jgi:hypothetical protein
VLVLPRTVLANDRRQRVGRSHQRNIGAERRMQGRMNAGGCVMVVLSALAAGDASAQPTAPGNPTSSPVQPCAEKRPLAAVAQTLAINLIVNRFDAWVLKEEWARADFESWSRNLDLGWEWDENAFPTNMFMHPNHGGLYFQAGRANCLSFWESVPLAFLGSWTWEYFGESFRPSLNDFFMTSFGGIALGEVLHRVAANIRDDGASGGSRISREVAAMVVDPAGGLNRLLRGEWSHIGPNPVEHDHDAFAFQLKAGARRVRETASGTGSVYSPTILADASFGDPFDVPYSSPYDVFTVRTQISPDGGGLNLLRAVGRLYGSELSGPGATHRHQFVVNQRFDYVSNPVYRFGEQSVQAGLQSLWWLGHGGFRLRTQAVGDVVVLGAIDAPDAGTGERTYDFGPAIGATVEVALERDGARYVSFYNRTRYLHAVSGARADHSVLFSGLDLALPIGRGLGVGIYLSGDERNSRYASRADDRRSYLETRVYMTWTSARRATTAFRP